MSIWYQPYKVSFSQREKVKQVTDCLLENNIFICRSVSMFASPIVLVAKSGSSAMTCVALNKANREIQILPSIDD
jgi:hypothetical protein